MRNMLNISLMSAAILLSPLPALAQSTLNIGPPPGQGGGGGQNQCVAVTLAGSVFVRVCGGGYSASGAGTNCSGGVSNWGNGTYRLSRGGCSNGQQFLGGSLSCFGTQCNWTPSPAGFAAGFRQETVYAQYQ